MSLEIVEGDNCQCFLMAGIQYNLRCNIGI